MDHFTPFRIEDAQSVSPSPLTTAHKVGDLNEKRSKLVFDLAFDAAFDVEDAREKFGIRTSLIMAELHQMLEKIKKIETNLVEEIRSQVSTTDFFRPNLDIEKPPAKRMKFE